MNDEGVHALGRGRWLVRVKRVDVRIGRQRNLQRTVAGSKADAVRVRDELRAQLAGAGGGRDRKRLRDYASEWLERRRAGYKPSVVRKYGFSFVHIFAELGDRFVDTLNPEAIDAYVSARTRDGAAGNTVLNELRLLRTIAKDSVADGYASRYWCERVRPPKVAHYTRERPNLLSPEQAGQVLARIPRQWIGLVFFLMTTGLRIGEATALRWGDVHGNVAVISRSNDRGVARTPKTEGSNRTVPALPAIQKLWGARRGDDELVFPTRRGALHRGSPLRRVLTEACAAAAAPRVTAHGLRRTFNNAGRQRGSREVLMSITGHVTEAMVGHYSIVDTDEQAELAAAVAASIEAAANGVGEVSGKPDDDGGKPA